MNEILNEDFREFKAKSFLEKQNKNFTQFLIVKSMPII